MENKEFKEEAIRWIKLKEKIDKLEEEKYKEYSKWCKIRDTYSNDYHKTMNTFEKPIND